MGRSAADHLSSHRREQSLLRSFSAIHRPPVDPARNHSTGQRDKIRQDCGPGSKDVRRTTCPSTGIPAPTTKSPTGTASSQANNAGVPVYERGMRVNQKGQDKGVIGAHVLSAHADNPPNPDDAINLHDRGNKKTDDGDLIVEKVTPTGPSETLLALPFPKCSVKKETKYKGFRKDYKLGDTLRSPFDVINHPTDERAFRSVNSLEDYDFAFVKRSDGSFSYAIVAYRLTEHTRTGGKISLVECMTFVMSEAGITKKVSRKHWIEYVRLVSTDEVAQTHRPPIRMISFDSQMDDECSMISNVSERGRAQGQRQVYHGNRAI